MCCTCNVKRTTGKEKNTKSILFTTSYKSPALVRNAFIILFVWFSAICLISVSYRSQKLELKKYTFWQRIDTNCFFQCSFVLYYGNKKSLFTQKSFHFCYVLIVHSSSVLKLYVILADIRLLSFFWNFVQIFPERKYIRNFIMRTKSEKRILHFKCRNVYL